MIDTFFYIFYIYATWRIGVSGVKWHKISILL